MELKATTVGQHLARHPYNKIRLLNAGVKVSGKRHQYLIPFTQLLTVHCKRGLVWGALEFGLINGQVIRLHGLEWSDAQRFNHLLQQKWSLWSLEMAALAGSLLAEQANKLAFVDQQDCWLTSSMLKDIKQQIEKVQQSLPLPLKRLVEFDNCKANYSSCLDWLIHGETIVKEHNQRWQDSKFEQYRNFFDSIANTPLVLEQKKLVTTGAKSVLIFAGAGSGKTTLLIARSCWLLLTEQATINDILFLSLSSFVVEEINQQLTERAYTKDVSAKTLRELVLQIVNTASNRPIKLSQLEFNVPLRQRFFISEWQKQCQIRKEYAAAWKQWLFGELAWPVIEGDFWLDTQLMERLAGKLEFWLALICSHGGIFVKKAGEVTVESVLVKSRQYLLAPLIDAWRKAIKKENSDDYSKIIQQAIHILQTKKFIPRWKHILLDEFQDISPLELNFIQTLFGKKSSGGHVFAVADIWQAVYYFNDNQSALITAFEHAFGSSSVYELYKNHRLSIKMSEIANSIIKYNPYQRKKKLMLPLRSNESPIILLPEAQLEKLLDKMSGFVSMGQKILLLVRDTYLYPEIIIRASTRWPKLVIECMTINDSRGLDADYVIVIGLQDYIDGFSVEIREIKPEKERLPTLEELANIEKRRLLYVAITRAKQKVWLLYDENQSRVAQQLHRLGVPIQKKP